MPESSSQLPCCGEQSPRNNLLWYAIRVQSKFECVAANALRGKGYQEFLPLYRARRRWSDRIKEIDLPLFPGYLFCRLDVQDRLLPILTTPGVMGILGAGKVPVPLSEAEIDAIQALIRSGLPAQPHAFLNVGEMALIESGPLKGIEGIVVSTEKRSTLVLSVPLLQRSVAVEIERDWIRPVPNRKTPASAPAARIAPPVGRPA